MSAINAIKYLVLERQLNKYREVHLSIIRDQCFLHNFTVYLSSSGSLSLKCISTLLIYLPMSWIESHLNLITFELKCHQFSGFSNLFMDISKALGGGEKGRQGREEEKHSKNSFEHWYSVLFLKKGLRKYGFSLRMAQK